MADVSHHDTSKISIVLYLPGSAVLRIGVHRNARISILRKAIQALPNDNNYSFVFHGIVLSDTRTLSDYKITNKDVIIVSKNVSKPIKASKWEWTLGDTEYIADSLQCITDSATKNEMYRLMDLHMSKIENNPKVYRKMMSSFEKRPQFSRKGKHISKCLETHPKLPLSDPLPVFWVETPLDGPIDTGSTSVSPKKQPSFEIDPMEV